MSGLDGGSVGSIALDGVSYWYGNVVAVNGITIGVEPGITGLVGSNGAGKSTLLHLMAGFLAPSAGTVQVAGRKAYGNPHIYRTLGLVPEQEGVHSFLSGYEFVLLNAQLHRLPDPHRATQDALERVGLDSAMHRRVQTYSKGMRQRVKLAGALVHEPPILLLDEPFNGMDPAQRAAVLEILRQFASDGSTVVISSHVLEELHDVADRVLVMVAGRLAAAGPFREIRRLMTDRPHTVTLRADDPRALAAALVGESSVTAVELDDGVLTVRTSERRAFAQALPRLARDLGISLQEVVPADESLESVFSYLVDR